MVKTEDLQQKFNSILEGDNLDSKHKRKILDETLSLITSDLPDADLKLLGAMLGEIRQGLEVFKPYKAWRKVSVFGSARTKESHPQYQQAASPQEN